MENNLGENIRFLRKKANLSQGRLAEMLHISPQAISKWENNKSVPDIETLNILASIFDKTIDELFNLEKDTNSLNSNETLTNKNLKTEIKLESEIKTETNLFKERSTFIIWNMKWLNPLGFLLNFILLLCMCHFFFFEHPAFQYIIIILLYLGLTSAYYLGFILIKRNYEKYYFILFIVVNISFSLGIIIKYIYDFISTIS